MTAPIPDEAVDAVVRALWEDSEAEIEASGGIRIAWDDADPVEMEEMRDLARIAIAAAAPHIRAQLVDEHIALLRADAERTLAALRPRVAELDPRRARLAQVPHLVDGVLYAADFLDGYHRVTRADREARGLPTGAEERA